jgi:UDP-N-acetylmuramoylalanine--D-glutamate ligase
LLPEEEQERTFEVVDTMRKAVELASRSAEPGDVVLLSPGAASFGLFKNEFDRGEQFRKAVEAL